jgi:hypothetical protein
MKVASLAAVAALVLFVGKVLADTPAISLSSFGVHNSNSCSGHSLSAGNNVPANGYCGNLKWTSTVTGGSYSYIVCYQVSYRNTNTSEWQVYDSDYVSVTDPVGTQTRYIDFWADMVCGSVNIAAGEYNIRAWICDYNSGTGKVTAVKSTSAATYRFHYNDTVDDDPLPDPEPSPGPYPGDNPPIDHPELPPSGPVGPGAVGSC